MRAFPLARLALACALIASVPELSGAQNRIDPAPAIRVVESAYAGDVARWVVEDPTPAEVLRVQVELARAGFDPGVRTGVLDGPTRAALSRFQTARGIVICGCLTYDTVVALGIRPQIVAFVQAEVEPDQVMYGDPGYSAGYSTDSQVIVVIPSGRFFPHRRHHHFPFPGVVVGHEPAVGAGQLDLRPPPVSVGVREITRPPIRRPGSGIRMGPQPPGGPPRPPRPIPPPTGATRRP